MATLVLCDFRLHSLWDSVSILATHILSVKLKKTKRVEQT